MIIRTVGEIIGQRSLAQIGPGETVREACSVLDRLDVGALAVLEGGELLGVLSERDVIRKCICASRPTSETQVRDIMTPHPVSIDVNDALPKALKLMTDGGFRHLPVVDNGRTVGLLSIREIPAEYHLMFERYVEAVATKPHHHDAGAASPAQ